MYIFTLPLLANEVREVAISGTYFELRNALYTVDIELLDKSGGVVNLLTGSLESDFVKGKYFQTIRITNGAIAQTVKFWHGEGEAGSRRSSGSVTGTVALDAPTLAALESIDVNAASLLALSRPLAAAAHWESSAGTTLMTVFTAAANANGAIVHSIEYSESGTNAPDSSFLAKATAPAGVTDGEVLLINGPNLYVSGTWFSNSRMTKEHRLSSGVALYFYSNVAITSGVRRGVRYTLL